MSAPSRVFPFQSSIETIRAHHWRHFTDAYTGCAFNCQYCLYKGPDDYGRHVKPVKGIFEPSQQLGIVDIGTNTDPYQPLEEKLRLTREILGQLLATRTPVFVLTRGTLVRRDIDVLQELARDGLVEVCLSIITLDPDISSRLEPRAPTPAQRIRVAGEIAAAGIPVSFHVAPMIPGLHHPYQWEELGRELGQTCGRHVFSAVLGAQRGFWDSFYGLVKDMWQQFASWDEFADAYPETIDGLGPGEAAITCTVEEALPSILALRRGVLSGGAGFVSENHPFLTTAAQRDGIYRWKLPTVYDMAQHVSELQRWVTWTDFLGWYRDYGPGPDLVSTVRSAWVSGELFAGTHLVHRPSTVDGVHEYQMGAELAPAATHTLVAKRRAAQSVLPPASRL